MTQQVRLKAADKGCATCLNILRDLGLQHVATMTSSLRQTSLCSSNATYMTISESGADFQAYDVLIQISIDVLTSHSPRGAFSCSFPARSSVDSPLSIDWLNNQLANDGIHVLGRRDRRSSVEATDLTSDQLATTRAAV